LTNKFFSFNAILIIYIVYHYKEGIANFDLETFVLLLVFRCYCDFLITDICWKRWTEVGKDVKRTDSWRGIEEDKEEEEPGQLQKPKVKVR